MSSAITWDTFSFGITPNDQSLPTPMVSISKEYTRDSAGKVIGDVQNISLEGTIFDAKNSGISYLLSREASLRSVFTDTTGCKTLSISCGSSITFQNCVVSKYTANKSTDNWTKTINYNIEIVSYGTGTNLMNICSSKFKVGSVEDSWSIETIEENSFADKLELTKLGFTSDIELSTVFPMYRVTRTIGAVGIGACGSGVKEAAAWVNCTVNDRNVKSNSIVAGLNIFNASKNISASEIEGSYKITYNWLASTSSSNYIETFNVETSIDSSLLRTVRIQGTIKGLEQVPNSFNNTSLYPVDMKLSNSISGAIKYPAKIASDANNKYVAAQAAYNTIKNTMYSRATAAIETYETPLHIIPTSMSEGWNPVEGTITYNYEYNNRPQNLISNSISESFTIRENDPIQEFSKIFVIGRKMGPIIRALGTYSVGSKSVVFEAVLPKSSVIQRTPFPASVYSSIEGLIESQKPNPSNGGVYVKDNTVDWSITDGRFTRTKTWEWTIC